MSLPELDNRFTQPPKWRWHSFKNAKGMSVRYGSAFPENSIPDAVVVILPGMSEFGEKYFEVAGDLLKRNYGVWVIDWPGQGRSDRYLDDRQKRHIKDFDDEVETLQKLIKDYTKPSAVHPEVGRIPLIMLGHSAGAHIGMRYLIKYPQYFQAAVFSAPMLRIKEPTWAPDFVRCILGLVLSPFGRLSVPGGKDWTGNGERKKHGSSIFSSDPVRDSAHYTYMLNDEELRVGAPTIRWYNKAVKSCSYLAKKKNLLSIKIPCLLALAGRDDIVDNRASVRALSILPNAQSLVFDEACHEILMEKDDIRDVFFERFDELVKENVLSNENRFEKF